MKSLIRKATTISATGKPSACVRNTATVSWSTGRSRRSRLACETPASTGAPRFTHRLSAGRNYLAWFCHSDDDVLLKILAAVNTPLTVHGSGGRNCQDLWIVVLSLLRSNLLKDGLVVFSGPEPFGLPLSMMRPQAMAPAARIALEHQNATA